MADTFRFWTHGVNVIPEKTKEYTGDDNGLKMKRTGWGTFVSQNKGTENWFHFPIPSATELDNDNVSIYHAWLRVKVNNDARIVEVNIHETQASNNESVRIYETNKHWKGKGFNITGQDTEIAFDIPDKQCTGPIVMSVKAIFDKNSGEVVFRGAGAWFEEWT